MNTIPVKTDILIGPALDWAVAKCEGWIDDCNTWLYQATLSDVKEGSYKPSTNWSQGGPIIDREMTVKCGRLLLKNETWATHNTPKFSAEYTGFNWEQNRKMYGPTPLIAAMRCYVFSKMGATVQIPKEMLP